MDLQAIHVSAALIEEVAEDYLLGRLAETDLLLYQEHLLGCDACFRAVQATDEFIALFREAIPNRGLHVA